MRNVLMVAPCFSPSSYPPSLRNRIFALHLKSFGWNPIILTIEPRYMEGPRDPIFEKMIPEDLEVVRTQAFPYQLTRKFGIGDVGIRSFLQQYRMAKRLCQERDISLLFITNPPWYVSLIGPLIKRKYGIPYVLDYIDPWVCPGERNHFFKKKFWAEVIARFLDPIAVKDSSAVISVSKNINHTIQELYPRFSKKIFEDIPYGIEQTDFDFARDNPEKTEYFNPSDRFYHIVYMGAVWKGIFDVLEAVFSALKKIKTQHPACFQKMRWHFIGTSYAVGAAPQVMPLATKFGVEEIVSEIPQRISYPSSLNVLTQANLILALGARDPHYASSKLFSCILAKRPLLAVYYEPSSALDILRTVKASTVISFSEENPVNMKIEEIEKAILRLSQNHDENAFEIDCQVFEKYSAINTTKKLADVFDRVLEDARIFKS